ncbi:MAG: hypothetical protein LHW64_10330 [Candidatus Cloacimonetes bacterium]|nr:hypothetical protein [Candidatus Cloacimonadota bacterium]MDY0230507.1 hypothetical protein [Candidatus Cloacimonadaceae bacterium]
MNGVLIASFHEGVFASVLLPDASVDYKPVIKWKTTAKNAFDPSIVIKRGKYRADSISIEDVLSGSEYQELIELLTHFDKLYIAFEVDAEVQQFPCEIDKLPSLSDNHRFGVDEVKFSFESSYIDKEEAILDIVGMTGYGNSYGELYGY